MAAGFVMKRDRKARPPYGVGGERMTIEVHVQPGSTRSELVRLSEGVLHLKVSRPPRGGEANRAVLELLSETLGLPKGALGILRGHTGRNKIIGVEGVSAAQLSERLARVLAGKGLTQG